jgi:hypothetical protein
VPQTFLLIVEFLFLLRERNVYQNEGKKPEHRLGTSGNSPPLLIPNSPSLPSSHKIIISPESIVR